MFHCFRPRNQSPPRTTSPEPQCQSKPEIQKPKIKEEILLQIPGATLHLMEGGDAEQVAQGDLTIARLTDENVVLVTLIKIGNDLQWPLTKDEPVVKLDQLHYLFSLPSEDGEILSYGVSFSQPNTSLASFDSFLIENSCFSTPPLSSSNFTSSPSPDSSRAYWKDYAPRIDDYNNVLARAIAGGTGQIIKGIFKVSNAYTKQVQKGGEMIRFQSADHNPGDGAGETKSSASNNAGRTQKGVRKGIKRVRKLSKMTEKMSKTLLDGVTFTTGTVTAPLVRSQAGKAFLNMVPGEVLLASLDAINRVMDAAEAAEKEALSATSKAVTRAVSTRFGESAGEITEDVFATAGHATGTAWNIFKIRKAINPASSVPSAMVKNAVKQRR